MEWLLVNRSMLNCCLNLEKVTPEAVLFAVTGVSEKNASKIMSVADAAFVGTWIKKDGIFENPVDVERVKRLMEVVNQID